MNYRHGFHAGNFADVHKHVLLIAILDYLLRKDAPIVFIETHAGRGEYDLTGPEAVRGDEWRQGIGRLVGQAPGTGVTEIERYLSLLRELGVHGPRPSRYPGSPLIACALLRPDDRAVFAEAQPDEAQALRRALAGRRHTSVLCTDGYQQLIAELPPRERRGLVLLDPPYESPTEYSDLVRALSRAVERWPTGLFAAWYPLKAGEPARRLIDGLAASGIRKILCCELAVRPRDAVPGLNGSGLTIVNPPWRLDERAGSIQGALLERLADTDQGSSRVAWLVPE